MEIKVSGKKLLVAVALSRRTAWFFSIAIKRKKDLADRQKPNLLLNY